jgi:hypothetical protein
LQTQLTTIDIDPKLEMKTPYSAFVEVDYTKKTVTLTLNTLFTCQPPTNCLMVELIPTRIELPIVSITTDNCSVPHVFAQQDLRLTDGDLQQIEVTENSKSKCVMAIPANTLYHFPSPTVVEYKTDGFDHLNHRGSIQTDSHFEGAALK